MNTDCRKCKAPMPPVPGERRTEAFVVTAYLCAKCGHWNDLKRREKSAVEGK